MVLDIEFLTLHGHKSKTVVYVAGPRVGYMQQLAAKYFPEHRFIFYCEDQEDVGFFEGM